MKISEEAKEAAENEIQRYLTYPKVSQLPGYYVQRAINREVFAMQLELDYYRTKEAWEEIKKSE